MIDHRAQQSPVRHQGDRPTCAGFAVSGAHEWIAGDGKMRSAEDAMWAGHQIASLPGREETSVKWALEGLEHHQHASEAAWPYGSPHWSAGRPAAATDTANQRALPPWRALSTITFDGLRDELGCGHAVILSVRIVSSAWRMSDGVIDAGPGGKTPGNHAVLAVGVSNVNEHPEHVIIKNSWGRHWGVAGYGLLTRRYLNHYGLRAQVLER